MTLIADHHARNESGFRSRSSSRCRSWVEIRSGCVVGEGMGKVRGKSDENSSIEAFFWATEGIFSGLVGALVTVESVASQSARLERL